MSQAQPGAAASQWVQRWSHLVAPRGTVLDVACGCGRHLRWFADQGCRVTGVDRDANAMQAMSGVAELVVADLEAAPWPWPSRRFDAVVVTNYLWRERLAEVVCSVAEGGVLIYETFAAGNESVGKPTNPQFLLRPGELLQACRDLHVVAYEDGFESAPERFVQRIAAVRDPASSSLPKRHFLKAPPGSPGQVKS
jgi:SAM-dependent methyltransferase